VHLVGNYLEQFPERYDSDSDSEFDSDEQDDYSDLELEDLEDGEDIPVKRSVFSSSSPLISILTPSSISEINEVSEPKKALKAKVAKSEDKPAAVSEKKRKAEDAAGDVSMTSTDGLSKNQKKKLAKKAKTEEVTPAPAAAAPAPKEKKDIKTAKVRKH
jgi:FK506-binding nuclear protein